jgi:hypothetical protein
MEGKKIWEEGIMSEFADIAKPIVELLERKNRDYGNSYDKLRDEFGPVAFYVRLTDKLERIKQVDAKGAAVNETAEDTIKDIVGYCLLELRYRGKIKRNEPAQTNQ